MRLRQVGKAGQYGVPLAQVPHRDLADYQRVRQNSSGLQQGM
jgi:hypothetical protein